MARVGPGRARAIALGVVIVAAIAVALVVRQITSTSTGGVNWARYPGLQAQIDRAVAVRDCVRLHKEFTKASRVDPITGSPADGQLMGYITHSLALAKCPAATPSPSAS